MTLVQKSAPNHIAEFCGAIEELRFGQVEKQNPLKLSHEVITGLAVDQLRSAERIEAGLSPNPPLLDIPLPEQLQQLIVSHIPFASPQYDYPGRECTGEDLCRRTGRAFLRHMHAVLHLQQKFNPQMAILNGDIHIAGSGRAQQETRAELPLNLAPNTEAQHRLDIIDGCPELGEYNDDDLAKLLTKFEEIEHLRLHNCNRLRTLEGVSKLRHLRVLELIQLSGLQNAISGPNRFGATVMSIETPDEFDLPPSVPGVAPLLHDQYEKEENDAESNAYFDLSKLDIPNLEELLMVFGSDQSNLRIVDARNCKKLQKITLKNIGAKSAVRGTVYMQTVVDVRGLNCQVFIDPLKVRFAREDTFFDWTKVLGTNPLPLSPDSEEEPRGLCARLGAPLEGREETPEQNASNALAHQRLREQLHLQEEESESSPDVSSGEESSPDSSPRAGGVQPRAILDPEEQRYHEERYIEEVQLEREALFNALHAPPPPRTFFEAIWQWLFSRDPSVLRSRRSFGQVILYLGELAIDWIRERFRSFRRN